jgi:hypothetical protein
MRHYIRTIFGDSTNYYGGDKWIEGGDFTLMETAKAMEMDQVFGVVLVLLY